MSSRREEKERRRQERLAQERQHSEQSRRRRTYSIVAGAVLGGAAVVAVIVAVAAGGGGGSGGAGDNSLDVSAADPPTQNVSDLQTAARAADCELKNPVIEGRGHLGPDDKAPEYKTNPPNSGNHDPVPANDGAYGKSPGTLHLVHSLEHGRILIYYKPGIPRQKLAQLKGLFDEDPYHVILVPNTTRMPYEVAGVAWGHIAGCKRLTDETFDVLRSFAERYRDKAPEFVP